MTPRSDVAEAPAAAEFNPFREIWRLLTNVKFALALVALLVLLSMIGVLIPQLPAEMRGNPAAESAWLEGQRQDFGEFTDPMNRLDMFSVFRSWWFNGVWLLLTVSMTVCTVSRFRPTWRNVRRPQKAVPDSYFERAHHRADFSHDGGVEAVERLLRRRKYRVERVEEHDGATYLFAERFSWSQFGTFLSHLALLMFLVGGFLTVFAGFNRTLGLAETDAAAPVFEDPGPGQIFIELNDAQMGVDSEGNIIDYRSDLTIRRDDEVVQCETTPNSPCGAFGYRFYQAAFFTDLARLRIEGPDGSLLYDDLVDFNAEVAPVPRLRVSDDRGEVLHDQPVPQLGYDADNTAALSQLAFRSDTDRHVWPVAWAREDGEMVAVVTAGGNDSARLEPGDAARLFGRYSVEFVEVAGVPSQRLVDLPGSGEGGALLQLVEDADGAHELAIAGLAGEPLQLDEGERASIASGYTYTFEGRVDGSGIDVRRDPGDTFIWIAVGMAMVGLSITFYVPRRRLWAKVSGDKTMLAGVAERTTRFGQELRRMGAELGAPDALCHEDREEERY